MIHDFTADFYAQQEMLLHQYRNQPRKDDMNTTENLPVEAACAAPTATPSDLAKLRHIYANLKNGGVRDTAQAKRIADGLLAPIIERLEQAATTGAATTGAGATTGAASDAEQAAPKAAPAGPLSSIDLMKVVMRADEALVGQCIRGTTNWAAAIGNAVQCAVLAAAPQQEEQEPVGEVQHLHELNDSWLNKLPIGTKLYTAPQPAPAPLGEREEFERWYITSARSGLPSAGDGWSDDEIRDSFMGAGANGKYRSSGAQIAWEGWQARAALAAQGGL